MEFLNQAALMRAVDHLAALDQDLARVRDRYGYPPLWDRDQGFPTLIHIILEQQVSLASARAAFQKLEAHLGEITPARLLTLDDETLKQLGFSRQKTRYSRLLAEAILAGDLDLESLANLEDAAVQTRLVKIKGIGPWTADIYLLMALCRPNIWPVGDLALVIAVKELKNLDQRPDASQMHQLAQPWQPYRAVAARLLWHYYLATRKSS